MVACLVDDRPVSSINEKNTFSVSNPAFIAAPFLFSQKHLSSSSEIYYLNTAALFISYNV